MKKIRLLISCTILLILNLSAGISCIAAESTTMAKVDARLVQLIELCEEIEFQDEVLTSSMTTYALTGESRWLNRYRKAAEQFDQTLSSIDQNYSGIDPDAFTRLTAAADFRYKIEQETLNLVEAGKPEEARQHLDSLEYQEQKKALIDAIRSIVKQLEITLADQHKEIFDLTPLPLTNEEAAWIESNKKVLVGNELDWPPFIFTDNDGNKAGITIDYLGLISRKTGLEFVFSEPAGYGELHNKLRAGDIDLIAAAYYAEDRSNYALHTPAYMIVKDFIYVPEDSDITGLNDLSNHTLAIPSGYSTINLIRGKNPHIKIFETQSVQESVEMLLSGEVDALMDSQSVVQYYIQENALRRLRSFPSGLSNNPLRMLVNSNKPVLRDILTKAVESISQEERLRVTSNWLQTEKAAPSVATSSSELTAAELDWLNRHPVIRIGADPDWRPFEFIDKQGEHSGIIADYMELISNQLGVKFQLPEINNWQETLDKYRAGEIDMIASLASTEERKKEFLLTEPYLTVPSVVITRKEIENIPDLSAIGKRKLGAVEGYSIIGWMNSQYPEVNLVHVSSISEGLKRVADGSLDAMLANQLSAIDSVNTLALDNLKLNFITEFEYITAIGVRKDWPELVPILEKIMKDITPAQRDSIRNKWISSELQELTRTSPAFSFEKLPLFKIVFITLSLVTFFMLIAWLLGRHYGDVQKLYQSSHFRLFSLLSVCAVLAMIFMVSWISLSHEEENIRQSNGESLQTVLNATQNSMRTWIQGGLRKLTLIANEPYMRSLFARLNRHDSSTTDNFKHQGMDSILAKQGLFSRDWHFAMILPDGTSALDNSISVAHLQEELKRTAFAGKSQFIPPMRIPGTNTTRMYYITPVIDYSGEPIAALVAEADPDNEFSAILLKGQIGDTGETYAVNHNGMMISNSRFSDKLVEIGILDKDETTILNTRLADPGGNQEQGWVPELARDQLPLTAVGLSLKDGGSGVLTSSHRDYRGVNVISAWAWDSDLGIGFVTEIDEDEALESYKISRNTLYTVLGIALFLTFTLLVFSSWIGERANRALIRAKDELEDIVDERTAELRQKEKNVSILLDSTPEPLIIVDKNSIIQIVNQRALEVFGYEKDELIGLKIEALVPERYRDLHISKRDGYIHHPTVRPMGIGKELSAITKDGTEFPIEVSLSPVQIDDKVMIVSAIRDISERKQAEQKIQHMNFMADQALAHTKAGYWHIPMDGSGYYNSSQRAVDIFGDIPKADFRYHVMEEWFANVEAGDAEHAKVTLQNFQDAIDGKIPAYNAIFAYKRPVDGNIVWIHARGTMKRNSEGVATDMYGVVQDVTEYIETQHELESAKEVAEAATEAKANFLAAMSHEIRTPMNGIVGMADLLRQSKLAEEHQQMLQTIVDSGHALVTIINDILDFSKIEAGKLQLENIDFSILEILESTAEIIKPNATKKNLDIITYVDPNIPQYVSGDQVRIRQILTNLLSNAIKFTERGHVTIRADLINSDTKNISIEFRVIDQGIGISKEGQKKLFKAFSQAESSTTRKYGGTGLGLSICKRLTELMKGNIGVESQEGVGSEFYVNLDFEKSDKTIHTDKVSSLEGLNILVVSSLELDRYICKQYLQYWDANVIELDDIAQCIDAAETAHKNNQPIDIIVLCSDWGQEQNFAVREVFKNEKSLCEIKFVLLMKGKRTKPRLDNPETVQFDVYPIRRIIFLTAVSIAAGRASPEVFHGDAVEDLTSDNAALSVDDAIKEDALILVAEDNPTNRDVIYRQLEILGYTCEMANDGKQALEAWKTGKYSILLTDCHMPEMDGYELTGAIRKLEKESASARKPIIAITANALQGEAERCLAVGMDDYMAKPIDMRELRNKLVRWLPHFNSNTERSKSKTVSAKTASSGKNTDADVIDSSALMDMFGDDPAMFKEILNDFIEPSQMIIDEVKSAYQERSAEKVKQAAHKLKSSARSVGANELADLCQATETAGKNEDWDTIDNSMQNIDEIMNKVIKYIKSL